MLRAPLLLALAVAGPGLAATAASAQDKSNYVTVFGGSSFAGDVTATGETDAGAQRQVDVAFGSDGVFGGSFVVGGAIGRTLASGPHGALRVEAEISRHSNDVEGGAVDGASQPFSGEQNLTAGFVNAAYDTPRIDGLFGTQFSLTAGGGIGIGDVEHEVRDEAAGAGIALRNGSTAFAYQVFVGSDLFLNDKWSLYSDARYVGVTEPDADGVDVATGAVDSRLRSEYGALALTSGLRYRF